MDRKASRIFEGYRALGLVTNHVPFVIRYISKLDDLRIVTCVGRYFYTFNSKLRLLETSHAHKGEITVLATNTTHIFSASQNEIYAWRHGHKNLVYTYNGHEHTVKLLLPFGQHLISVDDQSFLKIWEIRTQEIYLEIPFSNSSFEITVLFHPSTFVNKILLGSKQGSMQLWNIRTQKLVYTFKGWNSSILCIEQSPACNVVAIGLENGNIIIHDLKQDETVMNFKQEWGSVSSLSFRTDSPNDFPHMVSSSATGHIAVWNLEKRRLQSQMRNIHNGPIVKCSFLSREPLLITNSSDNALKVWCFDQPDDTGRILHLRDGHYAPPCKIRFHGSQGNWVLSAGLDSNFKCFSTWSERLNRSLGQASFNRKLSKKMGVKKEHLKMPPITEFAAELTREKEWDNIVACHRRLNVVTSWSFEKMKMGERKLIHDRFKQKSNVYALCVCLSACGNYVIVGYSTGHIDKFNVQSGIYRGSYGKDTAHDGAIQGVVSDSLNQLVVSGGVDGNIKFWRFKGEFLSSLNFDSSISQIIMHKESSLVAVSFDNYNVCIIDVEMKRVIREFGSHESRITDMTMSADVRWLIVASMDCSIRIWDLSFGKLVDHFLVCSPCVSLSMSPTGEFLATAHVQDLGVYLWANLSVYMPLNLRPLSEGHCPMLLDLPFVKADEKMIVDEEHDNEQTVNNVEVDEELINIEKECEAKTADLVTLSLIHSSRWKNLLSLDVIKKRNKPKEPVEKPKNAPFFIPVIPGLQPKLDTTQPFSSTDIKSQSLNFTPLSEFSKLLLTCDDRCNYFEVWETLKQLGPSAIDVEIRSLDTVIEGETSSDRHKLLRKFMSAVQQALKTRRDFEFVNACLALFLKIHSNTIIADEMLMEECKLLCGTLNNDWQRLRLLFSENMCIINYLKSVVL
ncbi:WD-repeat protein-like protein [Leptotrombidium deliense]|uniref:WD-repeat protein-like protein n=1 Tax=Leptotrombidium deliense TaxID=299467 RepID=A0A443S9K9_9ACAR|nr:WD-repeat protein-like protein [Leptotrombidium deliense]